MSSPSWTEETKSCAGLPTVDLVLNPELDPIVEVDTPIELGAQLDPTRLDRHDYDRLFAPIK